jgi:hypothetical protein
MKGSNSERQPVRIRVILHRFTGCRQMEAEMLRLNARACIRKVVVSLFPLLVSGALLHPGALA